MKLFSRFKKKDNEMRLILVEKIKECIRQWEKDDIYAISLYVQDEMDNPCEPVVILGYNTIQKYNMEIENAYTEQEAKWNYAFWLQNEEMIFGRGETQNIVKNWIKKSGYKYYTYDEMFCGDSEPKEHTYEGITKDFIQELIEIVKELHFSGFITEQFGKEIPILIHELEYDDEIAEQNILANTKELVEDFITFCCD